MSHQNPDVKTAARKILDVYDGKVESAVNLSDSPEPLRAIAHHLGYGPLDGTPWWDEVMDIVADN